MRVQEPLQVIDGVSLHCRVEGVRQACGVAVGEKHSLCLQCWHVPEMKDRSTASALHDGLNFEGMEPDTERCALPETPCRFVTVRRIPVGRLGLESHAWMCAACHANPWRHGL